MIICYTVPEIWHVKDVIVMFHFGLFFALLCPNSQKNENLKKWKKCLEISSFYRSVPKIIIIWYIKNTCRYNYQNLDDTIYNSWDMEQNILKLVILDHFLPFYPTKTPKIKILKNEKICWRYHHFTEVPKIMIIWYTVPEIWHVTDVLVTFHFGLFFSP